MTHGVTICLCAAHRSPEFLRRRGGRDLVGRLHALWSGAGCLTRNRARALEAHLRRVGQPGEAARPGSYAWPELRTEAEARFAAGERPETVIAELRSRHAGDPARPPSSRTMRRWFQDGRWLAPEDLASAPSGEPLR
jgi:hypothetical protein